MPNDKSTPSTNPARPIQELAAAARSGEVSVQAIVEQALQRAEKIAALNAFVSLDQQGARHAAQALDGERQDMRSSKALFGVPIVVKDNIDVAGLPTTGGTPALAQNVARADAPVVARLRAAGAVIIGKTSMHEMAFGISGLNPAYNTGAEPGVRNAYDPQRVAGGSSSGTAVALACRVTAAGLGTDTGGSLRIPCAFNACASLRPTIGRYLQGGCLPISHTRDTTGPMALSMADVALLDAIITNTECVEAVPDLSAVRLGIPKEFLVNLDDDTRLVFDATIRQLKSAGVHIEQVSMPDIIQLDAGIGVPLAVWEAFDNVKAYLSDHKVGVSIEDIASQIASPDVRLIYESMVMPRKLPHPGGELVDGGPIYEQALHQLRPQLQALYADTFAQNRLDALIFPTVPIVAMPAEAEASSLETFALVIQNTGPGSDAGVPGVQLPAGLGSSTGLPVGLALDGPVNSDHKLLSIALALEKILGPLPAPKPD